MAPDELNSASRGFRLNWSPPHPGMGREVTESIAGRGRYRPSEDDRRGASTGSESIVSSCA